MKPDKILNIIFTTIIIITISSGNCLAATELETEIPSKTVATTGSKPFEWGIGLQYTRPSSGISVIFPLDNDFSLQPIFYIDVNDNTTESLAYGVRGIYKLPTQTNLNPYIGLALGHNEHFKDTSSGDLAKTRGDGYEAFFGITYNKYILCPSFEIALGGYDQHGGKYQAGLTLNIAVMYYFQI
jgi:hypothetical protein